MHGSIYFMELTILEKLKATNIADLMYIIKSDDQSTFKNAIDILDEMAICTVPPGHYAEVPMVEVEKMLIKETEKANGIQ